MKNILIISHDSVFARCAQIILEDSGYSVKTVSELPTNYLQFDAALIDLETVKPVSLLIPSVYTAYAEGEAKYGERILCRPFYDEELLREIEQILSDDTSQGGCGVFVIEPERSRVTFNGSSQALTPRELELLTLLLENEGRAVSREEIIERVFAGKASGNVDAVYINYLRKKLSAISGFDPIKRVREVGYMLVYPSAK